MEKIWKIIQEYLNQRKKNENLQMRVLLLEVAVFRISEILRRSSRPATAKDLSLCLEEFIKQSQKFGGCDFPDFEVQN